MTSRNLFPKSSATTRRSNANFRAPRCAPSATFTKRPSRNRPSPARCSCSPRKNCVSRPGRDGSRRRASCRNRRRNFSSSTASIGSRPLSFIHRTHPGGRQKHSRPVHHFRRAQRGFRHGDVRHHQFHADPNQQKPSGGSIRAGFVGGAGPPFRRAHRRNALQRSGQPVALSHQSAGRPKQAGEMDFAGRALQRNSSLGTAGLAENRVGRNRQARRRPLLRHGARFSQGRRRKCGARPGATPNT